MALRAAQRAAMAASSGEGLVAAARNALQRAQGDKLRAVVGLLPWGAVEKQAKAVDPAAPLAGVSVLVKEVLDVAGLATTLGSHTLQRGAAGALFTRPRAVDSEVVAALKAAGAVVLGKTNVPEKGLDVQAFNPLFGTTGNPYDPARTSGGSSGGSAAAVASGLVPLAIGSDLAGSLRIPAHFCGVCSLRASPGRVPTAGHTPPAAVEGPEAESSLAIGALARDVDSNEPL